MEQTFNIELHCFCDSSLQVYSSVIYIYYLICSKTKVPPVKEIAVTRLELMPCVLLTKLLLKKLWTLQIIYCLPNSMIALYDIQNNKEWKVWVQNRVDIIDKVVKPDKWHNMLTLYFIFWQPCRYCYQEVSTKFNC